MFFKREIISNEFEEFQKIRLARIEENLRDYFAGQAISELCREQWAGSQFDPKSISERAYQIADSMIEERRKK